MSTAFETNSSKDKRNAAARKRYASKQKSVAVQIGSLTSTAMLASVSFSIWDAWTYDKPEGDKVAKRNHVEEGTVKVRKELFPFEAPSYDAIPQAYRRIKSFHEKNTLPWERGIGILAATNFDHYVTEIKKLMGEFDSAVRAFKKDYVPLKKQAKDELNGLYKEDDWPEENELNNRFGVSLFFYQVPSAGDFRVELQGENLKSVRQQIENDVQKKAQEAVQGLYGRVKDALQRVVEAVKEDKVKQPVFDALTRICSEDIPRLNVAADKNLIKVADLVCKELGSTQAKEVRENDELRKQVEQKAKDLSKQMGQFIQKK